MAENIIHIRPAKVSGLDAVYSLITSNDEWTKFNGPYFPYAHPSLEEFKAGKESSGHSYKSVKEDKSVIAELKISKGIINEDTRSKGINWASQGTFPRALKVVNLIIRYLNNPLSYNGINRYK